MSTKKSTAAIRKNAIDAVVNKLRQEQSRLKRSLKMRTYEIKKLVENQSQEKREIAELGLLIKNIESK